jgi:hypothetical protein
MDMVYSKNPDVVFRNIADEFILVPIKRKAADTKSIYTLNEAAAFIWKLLDGKNPVSLITEKVAQEFAAEPSRTETDTIDFLSHLEILNLIQKA